MKCSDTPRVLRTAPQAHRLRLVSCCVVVMILVAGPVRAAFVSATSSPTMDIGTATLAAPSGLGVVNGTCVALVSIAANLSWTATASTFADGYEILRSATAGGPYTAIGTVSGRLTTTYIDTTTVFAATYYYVVRATKLLWRSSLTAESSLLTLTSACL